MVSISSNLEQQNIVSDVGDQDIRRERDEEDVEECEVKEGEGQLASICKEPREGQDAAERKGKRKFKEFSSLSKENNWKNFSGFKCYFEGLISECNGMISKFDKKTREILNQTPFGPFFDMIIKGTIVKGMVESCSYSIIDIIGMYTGEGNGFVFNDNAEEVNLEAEDVSLMFGIPLRGETFDTSDRVRHSTIGEFESKYFKNAKRITKKELRSVISEIMTKTNKTEQDRIDIVKMMLLYSFATFFFATTNGGVAKIFLKKFETLSYVNKCSWPLLIHAFLMKSIRTHYKKPTSVSGCVYVLLYFLVEHTDLLKPLRGTEQSSPRVCKWNLSKLTKKNWADSISRLQKSKVNVSVSGLTIEEKELLNMDRRDIENKIDEDVIKTVGHEPNRMADVPGMNLCVLLDAIDQDYGGNLEHDTTRYDYNEGLRIETNKNEEDDKVTQEIRSNKNNDIPGVVDSRKEVEKTKDIKGKKQVESNKEEDINDDEEDETDNDDDEETGDEKVHCEVDYKADDDDEDEEVELEKLPDDIRQLKHILLRERGTRERLKLKLKHLEELEEHNEKKHALEDESERYKADIKRMSDYWNEAYDIYHRDNLRIEESFVHFVAEYELERVTNERMRSELNTKIEHLNNAYASQTKIVQEMIRERTESANREQKLLRQLADANMKLFPRGVEAEVADNSISIEGVEGSTPADNKL